MKKTIILFLGLVCSIGMSQAEKYYLFTPTSAPNPSHTGTLSGDFLCQQTPQSSSKTFDTYTFSHYVLTTASIGTSPTYYGLQALGYDVKTTKTKFTIYWYNANSSASTVSYKTKAEGGALSDATSSSSVAKNTQDTYEFSIDNTTNTRVYISSSAYSKVQFYQIVAEETGEPLPQAGQAGWNLLFYGTNASRYANKASGTKSGKIDGLECVLASDNKTNSQKAKLTINTTDTYIKFTTGSSPVLMKVTCNYPYSLNTVKAVNSTTTESGTAVSLAANTDYYITGSEKKEIQIEKIEFLHPFHITDAGWASLYLNYPTEVPEGLTAYYASSTTNSSITLTAIDETETIPANTGVVVKGDEGDYNLGYSTATPETVSTNIFKGVIEATSVAARTTYVLSSLSSGDDCVFGLYTGETLGAYKAYILASDRPALAPEAGRISFVIDETGDATDINNIQSSDKAVKFVENGQVYIMREGVVYDLTGRVVR